VIAHELGALRFIRAGFNKRQLYYLLLKNSQIFTEAGRRWAGYSYKVSGQWQGTFKRLHVIGDKHGEDTTLRLGARPRLLQSLRRVVNGRIRFIHIIRNPYDNISTIFLKTKRWELDLRDSVDYYFFLCHSIVAMKKQIDDSEMLELRHEAFVREPKRHLKQLCDFLGVEAREDYLKSCARIVFKSPYMSRYDLEWDERAIETVQRRMDRVDFLKGYSYDCSM
jgi:hypothetical protein